jgi:hypothetical protein
VITVGTSSARVCYCGARSSSCASRLCAAASHPGSASACAFWTVITTRYPLPQQPELHSLRYYAIGDEVPLAWPLRPHPPPPAGPGPGPGSPYWPKASGFTPSSSLSCRCHGPTSGAATPNTFSSRSTACCWISIGWVHQARHPEARRCMAASRAWPLLASSSSCCLLARRLLFYRSRLGGSALAYRLRRGLVVANAHCIAVGRRTRPPRCGGRGQRRRKARRRAWGCSRWLPTKGRQRSRRRRR